MNDTKRLDWVIGRGVNFDSDRNQKDFWITWYQESYWRVARGKSWRCCIDAAMRNEYETIR